VVSLASQRPGRRLQRTKPIPRRGPAFRLLLLDPRSTG